MKALVLNTSIPRIAASTIATKFRKDGPWSPFGVLRLEDVPAPAPPQPGWVHVKPTMSGICGSEVKLLEPLTYDPILSAFNPYRRIVPGHEVTGVVQSDGKRFRAGDRVLVEPIFGCTHKQLDDCRRCEAGQDHLCEHLPDDGPSAKAQGIGFAAPSGGGWSEMLAVPENRLYSAAGISDERAVLAEPFAVAMHAVQRWTRRGDHAVVIGPGCIGLLTIAALRHRHPDVEITVIGPPALDATFGRETLATSDALPSGVREALLAGAQTVICRENGAAIDALAAMRGERVLRPRVGKDTVLSGGVDAVFDCVAFAQTLDLALRILRGRGELIMVGTAARTKLNASMIWWRELTIRGTLCYAVESDGRRTFEQTREALQERAVAVDHVLTHTFPFRDYREALAKAKAGPRERAIRVAFDMRAKHAPRLPLVT